MGENWRVLIYLYNCKYCVFGGVGQWPYVLPPFTQPLPNSIPPPQPIPTHPNPFLGTVLDQEHKKRNRDGTIVIRMNDLAEQGTNDLNDLNY